MKLIFLNRYFHPDISATSQMLTSLAFHLASRGSEVHVITSRQRYDDPQADLPASESGSGVHIHRVWTSRFGRQVLAGRAIDYASFYLAASLELAFQDGKLVHHEYKEALSGHTGNKISGEISSLAGVPKIDTQALQHWLSSVAATMPSLALHFNGHLLRPGA